MTEKELRQIIREEIIKEAGTYPKAKLVKQAVASWKTVDALITTLHKLDDQYWEQVKDAVSHLTDAQESLMQVRMILNKGK